MHRAIALSMPMVATLALASCGGASTQVARRPAKPVFCPLSLVTGGPATKAAFDARALLGMPEGAASATAARHGCSTRPFRVDGKPQAGTADFVSSRLDLDLEAGAVVAVRVG